MNSNEVHTTSPNAHDASGGFPTRVASRTTIPELEIPTEYGVFEAHDLSLWLDDFLISGTVTNRTARDWRWAAFRLRLFDQNARELSYDDRFDGHFYLQNIPKGETRSIIGLRGDRPGPFILKPEGSVASFGAEFVKERSYFDTHLGFSLIEPIHSSDLFFCDDWIHLTFDVTKMELRFTLRNRTVHPLEINWNDCEYIDFEQRRHKVVHRDVPLADRDKPQTPTNVAALSTVNEMVYPADRVAGSRVFEDWRLNPLLPLSQYAEAFCGKSIGLTLPLKAVEGQRCYRFTIQLTEVLI